MDELRSQVAALTRGPTAVNLARRAEVTRLVSTIDTVSLAGLALGVLAGLAGVALFASSISRRVTVAAANADRLGEGMNGHLTAASVPGQGMAFTLTLPRAPDMIQAPAGDEGIHRSRGPRRMTPWERASASCSSRTTRRTSRWSPDS
jgi:hypothetical protein